MNKKRGSYYIMIKGSVQQEQISIVKKYTASIGTLKYIRQILTDIKGEIDSI